MPILAELQYEQQKISTKRAPKVAGKVAGKVAKKVVEKVTENQQMIMTLIKKNPYVSARELAQIIGISHRKTQENIAKLKEYGFIERVGPAKGGYWKTNRI